MGPAEYTVIVDDVMPAAEQAVIDQAFAEAAGLKVKTVSREELREQYARELEAAEAEVGVKYTPPRLVKAPTKLQKRLLSMREFFRRLTASQIEEAQRIHRAFMQPRFNWVPPRNRVSQAKRRRYARQQN